MARMKQIHDFAVKWCDKFRDQNTNYRELVDHFLADDCAALGFEMDCGHAFSEKYGQAASSLEALERIIDDVMDIPLLGSAIYSRWRYFNHWVYDGAAISEPKNREWFILALSRLALLSDTFQGDIKKACIVSNNVCYGPMPKSDREVKQHLTINDEGCVWFSGYNFGTEGERYEKARTKNFKIEKASAVKLLNILAAYFENGYIEDFATDIGDWVMELTTTEGVIYKFRGSLCAEFDYEGTDLSDIVRDTVGMNDLYVFDGNCKPDMITKITLDYHRSTRIKSDQKSNGAAWDFVTWDYTEHLIIDRETETLEHIQNIGTGCKVSRRYEIEDGVESLFEIFDEEDLFSYIEGTPDDVIETPNETRNYRITLDYRKNPQRVIEGCYDKNGLPADFIVDFIRFYGMGEILDPAVYGKKKRRQSEYIFCSVMFEEGHKSYYYLTDDDSIEVGDFVLVPAGKDNHEAVVEIVDIEYFSAENVPLPVEKTKRIIRKCTDEM